MARKDPEGKEGTMTRQLDSRSGRGIGAYVQRILAEVKDWKRCKKKDEEDRDCQQGNNNGDSERQLDPTSVEPDKNDIA